MCSIPSTRKKKKVLTAKLKLNGMLLRTVFTLSFTPIKLKVFTLHSFLSSTWGIERGEHQVVSTVLFLQPGFAK
jgi:hypothetical protein